MVLGRSLSQKQRAAIAMVAALSSASAAQASGDYDLFPAGASDQLLSAGTAASHLAMADPTRTFAEPRSISEFQLGLRFASLAPAPASTPQSALGLEPARKPNVALGVMVLVGSLAGSAYGSWRGGRFSTFHFTNEQFFGQNTYTGGADKASHFVDYNVAARLLTLAYQGLGYPTLRSQLYGSSVAFLAGLTTEIGDGTTKYGFSYEDLVMDAFGTATAFGLAATGWDDTIGFRIGRFNNEKTPACCYTNANYGRDYSGEIYTGDLKIEGLARRLKLRPGVARYLLLTMNYGTNGYRYATAAIRQRLLGLEVGLNFVPVLKDLGVSEKTWWGRDLYLFFSCFRIPYTGLGFRYDLNHRKWYGPTAGFTPFDTNEAAGGR